MADKSILVSGPTGKTGRATIDTLLKKNKPIRALVRKDDAQAAELRARGVEIVVGDLLDFDSLRRAMKEVGSAYFLYPVKPGLLDATSYFALAAKEAGVTAIVNMSQISARRDSLSHAAQNHWVSERIFDWSGIATTHLRPTFFADWLTHPLFAKAFWKNKQITFPFGNARHAPIASEDQGRVIGSILADPAPHAGQTYTLHGPVEMNHDEIAQEMSKALGTEISYSPIEIEEFQRILEEKGADSFFIQHLAMVAQDYRNGVFAGTNDVIERITGEPPMTVERFISLHREAFY